VFRPILLFALLAGCDLAQSLLDDASPPPSTPTPAADATPEAPTEAPEAAADGSLTVKNPLGTQLQAKKVTDPAAGSPEHTILGALASQAANGSFEDFVAFVHPSAKAETQQVERLRAYTWEQSRGAKAARCAHDGGSALIVVARTEVKATIEGGGSTGQRLSVWCGEDRMPVPFTLYPDGDVWRFTQFGLN